MVIASQDGHPIDDITWMRYRKNKNVLKVRNANHDDTGIYTCKGINGFGSSEARIEVIIVGESWVVRQDLIRLNLLHFLNSGKADISIHRAESLYSFSVSNLL